jgi:hypothetical protein
VVEIRSTDRANIVLTSYDGNAHVHLRVLVLVVFEMNVICTCVCTRVRMCRTAAHLPSTPT